MSTAPVAEGSSAHDLVGKVVAGKYRIERLIGQGGMGAVFEAKNLVIEKRVALKFLAREAAKDSDAAERFQREALAASVVESSHIVQIFDSGTSDDGLPFLVMELLQGEDLRARLRREKRLTVESAAAIAAQVLRALVRAHAAGIVHRDLKPDNVFLCQRDDDALFLKIVDFGVSKLSATRLDTLTRRGTVLGTAYYMSPEQAQAFEDIDGRTDLFSVGAILYECLAGRPPHVGPTYEAVLIALCTKEPGDLRELAPDVPRPLADVVHRALARERNQRFASAQAMLDALCGAVPNATLLRSDSTTSVPRALTTEETASADSTTFTSTARDGLGSRRRRARSIAMGVVAVLAGFALTAVWLGVRRSVVPETSAERAAGRAGEGAASLLPPAPAPAPSLTQARIVASPPAEPAPTPSVSTRSAAPPRALSAKPGKPASDKSAAPAAKPARGVAQGLELSTREP